MSDAGRDAFEKDNYLDHLDAAPGAAPSGFSAVGNAALEAAMTACFMKYHWTPAAVSPVSRYAATRLMMPSIERSLRAHGADPAAIRRVYEALPVAMHERKMTDAEIWKAMEDAIASGALPQGSEPRWFGVLFTYLNLIDAGRAEFLRS
jgi:hypothetical protein